MKEKVFRSQAKKMFFKIINIKRTQTNRHQSRNKHNGGSRDGKGLLPTTLKRLDSSTDSESNHHFQMQLKSMVDTPIGASGAAIGSQCFDVTIPRVLTGGMNCVVRGLSQ